MRKIKVVATFASREAAASVAKKIEGLLENMSEIIEAEERNEILIFKGVWKTVMEAENRIADFIIENTDEPFDIEAEEKICHDAAFPDFFAIYEILKHQLEKWKFDIIEEKNGKDETGHFGMIKFVDKLIDPENTKTAYLYLKMEGEKLRIILINKFDNSRKVIHNTEELNKALKKYSDEILENKKIKDINERNSKEIVEDSTKVKDEPFFYGEGDDFDEPQVLEQIYIPLDFEEISKIYKDTISPESIFLLKQSVDDYLLHNDECLVYYDVKEFEFEPEEKPSYNPENLYPGSPAWAKAAKIELNEKDTMYCIDVIKEELIRKGVSLEDIQIICTELLDTFRKIAYDFNNNINNNITDKISEFELLKD